MCRKLLFSILAIFLILNCKAQISSTKDDQKTIESTIDGCISLLEKRDYKTMFENYIYPEYLKKILQDEPMDELIAKFAEKKADRMLKALKVAKRKKIEYKENETVGIIDLEKVEDGPHDFVFRKVGDLWYIANE